MITKWAQPPLNFKRLNFYAIAKFRIFGSFYKGYNGKMGQNRFFLVTLTHFDHLTPNLVKWHLLGLGTKILFRIFVSFFLFFGLFWLKKTEKCPIFDHIWTQKCPKMKKYQKLEKEVLFAFLRPIYRENLVKAIGDRRFRWFCPKSGKNEWKSAIFETEFFEYRNFFQNWYFLPIFWPK